MPIGSLRTELRFLLAVWKANLLSAMEYRVAFLTQIIGMFLNNALYFVFWIIFFDRFEEIRGWGLDETLMVFAVVATSIGLGSYLFGNCIELSTVIAGGRLDYYLSLPRAVLPHVLSSRSQTSGLGDILYGISMLAIAGHTSLPALIRFGWGVAAATAVFVAAEVMAHSLAFWMGRADLVGRQVTNALITFALYPLTLFEGTARLLLFTVLPAALIGAVPAQFVQSFRWQDLALLSAGALVFLALAIAIFQLGLARYESGSAIQTEV